MKVMHWLATAAIALSLCGCAETIFESTAGTDVRPCDKQLVGNWRVTPTDGSSKDEALFITVDADCKAFHFIEDGKEDADMAKKTHVSFANVGEKSVLMAKLDDDTNAKGPDAQWSNGYHYFLYERSGDEIHLHPVDDERVAHLIVDGKIFGRVEKISRRPTDTKPNGDSVLRKSANDSLHNYVAGKPEDMAHAVEMEGVFSGQTSHILKSVTRAEMSKAAEASKKAKP